MRSRVDFPQPDGPTSTANWPSSMSMSTPRITCVPPKYFCIARICTDAMRRSFLYWYYLRMIVCAFCNHIGGPACLGPIDQDRKSTRLNPVTNAHLVCRLLLEKQKNIILKENRECDMI